MRVLYCLFLIIDCCAATSFNLLIFNRSSMMSFRSDASSARGGSTTSANGGGRQALGTASVDLSLNAFSSSHTPLGMLYFFISLFWFQMSVSVLQYVLGK